MERLLGGLAIVAAILLTTAFMLGAGPFASPAWTTPAAPSARHSVDVISFVLGFVAALTAVGISRVPWGDIPRRILASILGWRRHAVLMGLAVISAGVLLLY